MTRRSTYRFIAIIASIPVSIALYDYIVKIYWVGYVDLQIEFVVIDAETRKPVPRARLEIISEEVGLKENNQKQFVVDGDTGGSARPKLIEDCMCSGVSSGLHFSDQFAVRIPYWRYRASADGFKTSEWEDLYRSEMKKNIERVSPQYAKILVPVRLERSDK